jgi:hypothetical protein
MNLRLTAVLALMFTLFGLGFFTYAQIPNVRPTIEVCGGADCNPDVAPTAGVDVVMVTKDNGIIPGDLTYKRGSVIRIHAEIVDPGGINYANVIIKDNSGKDIATIPLFNDGLASHADEAGLTIPYATPFITNGSQDDIYSNYWSIPYKFPTGATNPYYFHIEAADNFAQDQLDFLHVYKTINDNPPYEVEFFLTDACLATCGTIGNYRCSNGVREICVYDAGNDCNAWEADFALAKIDNSAKYYQIYLENKDDQITKKGVIVRTGPKEVSTEQKSAVATLYSLNNDELSSTSFDLPGEGKSITLEMPYYNLGKEVVILSIRGEELLRVSVAAFAKSCEDGVCQDHESYYSCSQDCSSGGSDGFCDSVKDGICDKDCLPKNLDPDYPDCPGQIEDKNTNNTNTNSQQKPNIVDRNDNSNQGEQLNKDKVNADMDGNKSTSYLGIVVGFIVLVLIVLIVLVVKNMNKEE